VAATLTYSPAIQALLQEDRLLALGPGAPNGAARAALKELTIERTFAPQTVANRDYALACLAGLWLYHDFLDESHQISQDLNSAEGSYWHGFMHRREPDYANAKYWFRRVGRHPVFEALYQATAALTHAAGPSAETSFLIQQKAWDPFAFIDLCEAASHGKADELLCRTIQRREWDLLFEYCYRRAVD
jgi:hypothetical protein